MTSVRYAIDKQILDGVQIAKDIERSLYYYPQGMRTTCYSNWFTIIFDSRPNIGMSAPFKEHKQKELRDLIMEVLWRNPKLNYYQVCKVGRSDNGGIDSILMRVFSGLPRHMCMFSASTGEKGCHTCRRKCCFIFSKISFLNRVVAIFTTLQMWRSPHYTDNIVILDPFVPFFHYRCDVRDV